MNKGIARSAFSILVLNSIAKEEEQNSFVDAMASSKGAMVEYPVLGGRGKVVYAPSKRFGKLQIEAPSVQKDYLFRNKVKLANSSLGLLESFMD